MGTVKKVTRNHSMACVSNCISCASGAGGRVGSSQSNLYSRNIPLAIASPRKSVNCKTDEGQAQAGVDQKRGRRGGDAEQGTES